MSVSEQGGFEFDGSKRPIAADHVAARGFGRFPWKPALATIKKTFYARFYHSPRREIKRRHSPTLTKNKDVQTCAPRRDLTKNRVKGSNFSGATRRNPENGAKKPNFFRRYAPEDSPPHFPTQLSAAHQLAHCQNLD